MNSRPDVLLGDEAVDREHDRRRDQDAERAARRDHAGCDIVAVAEATHLGQRDVAHGRRGRDRRAADRGEAAARADGGEREAAAEVAEPGVAGAKQFLRHPRCGREHAHQDEHRDQAEVVVGRRAHRRRREQVERRAPAGDRGEPADPGQRHGDADRHPHQHHQEHRRETRNGDEIGRAHSGAASPMDLALGSKPSSMSTRRLTMVKTEASTPSQIAASHGQTGRRRSKVDSLLA